jgi:hypothetical protein
MAGQGEGKQERAVILDQVTGRRHKWKNAPKPHGEAIRIIILANKL